MRDDRKAENLLKAMREALELRQLALAMNAWADFCESGGSLGIGLDQEVRAAVLAGGAFCWRAAAAEVTALADRTEAS